MHKQPRRIPSILWWGIGICVVLILGLFFDSPHSKQSARRTPVTIPEEVMTRTPRVQPTPVPTETAATFETICKIGGSVFVEGFLDIADPAECGGVDDPPGCGSRLRDPLSDRHLPLLAGGATGLQDSSGKLPDAEWFLKYRRLRDLDMALVRGTVRPITSSDGQSMPCAIHTADVWARDEFTTIQWQMPRATLREAVKKGWMSVQITGQGLRTMQLKVEPQVDFHVNLEIEQGTIFTSADSAVQDMVVRNATFTHIRPSLEAEIEPDVSCINMRKKQPTGSDTFTVSQVVAQGDLLKLLRLKSFGDQRPHIQQFAVWTITDNPPPGGYVGLGAAAGFASGPDLDELRVIRELFLAAGIDPNRYQALAR